MTVCPGDSQAGGTSRPQNAFFFLFCFFRLVSEYFLKKHEFSQFAKYQNVYVGGAQKIYSAQCILSI